MVHNQRPDMHDPMLGSEQVIVVEPENPGSFHATVKLFEKINGQWFQTMESFPAVIGRNGSTNDKTEGDGKSPKGMYELGESFGTKQAPAGIIIPYHQVTNYDYWIDDQYSDDYNQWMHYEGNPSDHWKSFERLNHRLYTHAIIVKYNMAPIIKGKGSAIFMHQWEGENSPTAGCVAMSYDNLVRLMRAIYPQKHPIIRIG
ncbi:L,D-transpeptidase family protein [Paenibacillus radicis (ex Xue et al. 2023)]|uniref:L,D-transpeptidase family protein n=1 Tax=Paenibacillus radicis (ex Xue et al. 2023) TaxID=2972489 RepID=A0ABT1YII9_9BACL|nr:L,D-transpeptidase family protein [Paenibacillus radicis (ex Xue et al. 2023)]MCR8633010.1 L,D-transpeptidase family protein [Paenibacillus radicis (ex Xue et al. 2023)]